MPQPIATWNPTRMLWETDTLDLFSEHSEPYSETLPTSGMTRSGRLLPPPTSVPVTAVNESSSSQLLPTPTTRDHKGRNQRNDITCLPGAIEQM